MSPLQFGPYHPPECHRGDWLLDEITGLTEVGGWSKGPIPWPRRKKTGTASLLLTGDLVRAVRTESVEALTEHWGVGVVTVWKWRKALGVDRMTEGSRQLISQRSAARTDFGPARGLEAARAAEAVAKMRATKTGRPASPGTRAALIEAASRPKGPGWGARANAWMLAGKARKDGNDA